MSNPTKGIFSVPKKDEYVPKPTDGQRNLRFGMPGVAATDPEPISDFSNVPEKDEVRIHGEGISRAEEDRNIAELKALVREREEQECKEREDHKPGPQSANIASALGKYATAVAQERLENPSDLTNSQYLPPIQHPDEKELLNRLKEEARTRQRIENYEMEATVKGGVAAHVRSAADKLANDLKTH
ncbi:11536_t:CDS:2 [Dentiscutata heterogama]|uniref:11536_t:CDS:1 n=1 Tax=Dentiscutata heterogama TaxID=1316150 RepID=A0ACA9JVE2_9GLOM|nr:11536_t:CDS:2 [Dentiscutata heterogama]